MERTTAARDGVDDEMLAWLNTQLDHDERAARNASPGPWRYNPRREFRMPGGSPLEFVGSGPADTPDFHGIAATGPADDPQSMADAAHIARQDPVHVLHDVAAKRKILEHCRGRDDLEQLVRTLVSGYADRAGYRSAWAPPP